MVLLVFALPAGAGWEAANAAYKKGDFATVMKELRLLAEQGDVNAQYNVGVMYAQGDGVARGDSQVLNWFRKAARQGNAGAQMNLGIMYSRGVALAMTEKQVSSAIARARQWVPCGRPPQSRPCP